MKTKLPPIGAIDQNLGKLKYSAFENELDLCCLAALEMEGNRVGGLVLNKGDLDSEENFQIIFGFRLVGLHEVLTSDEVKGIAEALNEALKFLPKGEKCTFFLGCYSENAARQKQLSSLAANESILDLARILVRNEQARINQLTGKGLRKEWEQIIFCSWTPVAGGTSKKVDPLSNLISTSAKFITSILDGFAGRLKERQEQFLSDLLVRGYYEGFQQWDLLLGNRAKLSIQPLDEVQLWDWLWRRFNTNAAPPIPQLLVLKSTKDELGQNKISLSEKNTTNFHATSVLIAGDLGKSSCPEHRGSTNKVFVKNSVCGVMSMKKAPKGWDSLRHQLLSTWLILSQPYVRDTEVFVELSPANKFLTEDNLVRQAKQSNAAQIRAIEKGSGRDVGAEVKQDESFDAQKKLYKGAEPINTAVVFLLYRSTPGDLDAACEMFSHLFGTATVIRETNIASKVWLETLPITWSRLLHTSSVLSERRLTLDNETVAGVLPLTVPRSLDSQGVELLTERGGKSVCIDLFSKTQHALVTGMTGSGKSVLLWRFMLDALSRNIPIVGMDFPAADGESSFKTGIELLGDDGAYFDISSASSNLMEPPDLRRFDLKQRKERFRRWQNFLRETLNAIVMGQVHLPHLAQRVDSILQRALVEFFADPDIIERYGLAFELGWKSPEWQQMPVLKDLLRFCSVVRLKIHKPEALDHQAINQIHSQIEALLASSLGNALGKPSSFSPEPMVKFYALTGLNNDYDAYIMALNANAACVRVAMSYPQSLFVGDELSVLCRREGFATMLGTLCATARKDGLSLLLSAQDPDTISGCSTAAMIMQNISYRLTGKITANAVNSFESFLKYPREIIGINASEAFQSNLADIYSCWLVEVLGRFWRCRFYPSELLLASIANNQAERMARARVFALYGNSPKARLYALKEFSNAYIDALKAKRGFEHIGSVRPVQDKKVVQISSDLSSPAESEISPVLIAS